MSINRDIGKNWCDFHGDPLIFGPLVAKKLVKIARFGGLRTTLSWVNNQFRLNFTWSLMGVLGRNNVIFMEIRLFLALL